MFALLRIHSRLLFLLHCLQLTSPSSEPSFHFYNQISPPGFSHLDGGFNKIRNILFPCCIAPYNIFTLFTYTCLKSQIFTCVVADYVYHVKQRKSTKTFLKFSHHNKCVQFLSHFSLVQFLQHMCSIIQIKMENLVSFALSTGMHFARINKSLQTKSRYGEVTFIRVNLFWT